MPSLGAAAASLSSRRALAPLARAPASSSSPRARGSSGPAVAASAVQRRKALLSISSLPLLRQPECNDRRQRRSLAARSLKADNAAETDWRVKEMMDSVRTYFGVWSGKDPSTVDALLSDDFVHIDEIWSGAEVVAGLSNFKKFVARTREAYPDLSISVEDSGAAGAHRVFVRWSGSATNLGRYHGAKASRHASALSGIDLFTFSPDRAKLEEVLVYRTGLAEDKIQLEQFEAEGHGLHELKLHRLHDENSEKGKK